MALASPFVAVFSTVPPLMVMVGAAAVNTPDSIVPPFSFPEVIRVGLDGSSSEILIRALDEGENIAALVLELIVPPEIFMGGVPWLILIPKPRFVRTTPPVIVIEDGVLGPNSIAQTEEGSVEVAQVFSTVPPVITKWSALG